LNNELFRFIRVSRRLSQREFAKAIGISHGMVSHIETNLKPVTARTAAKVQQAFDLTDEELAELSKVLKCVV